ncbi:CaiB/baiF CoA-transferase family protein [Acrasis kona]|uniref:CaiB/baiF CoA-transferase family protein n=1 Tax=Acrasis kona TaxID=1008807 RepID=A0AAW2YXR3_9EUKA
MRLARSLFAVSSRCYSKELPLSNVRVLDLSRVLAGPYCTQTLGDLGAEVIKVENKKTNGDDTRAWGPPFHEDTKQSAYFLSCNRNKKSITVDIKTEKGQKIIQELAQQSHVFIENFKVDDMKRFNLDFETLSKINSKIVYCSITGYGQDGPNSHLPGYDFVAQALSGLMSITGDKDTPPYKVGVALIDVLTGMYASVGILASLRRDDAQHIDVSLFDTSLSLLVNQAQNYLVSGKSPTRMGNSHPNISPYDLLHAKDGPLVVTIGNDKQFAEFADAIGDPSMAADIKFQQNKSRVANREELIKRVEDLLIVSDRSHWIEKFQSRNIPCGPVNTVEQALNEPQVKARNMLWNLSRGTPNDIPSVGNPLKFKYNPITAESSSPPPLLGEHTDQVLKNVLGYSQEQINDLRLENVI